MSPYDRQEAQHEQPSAINSSSETAIEKGGNTVDDTMRRFSHEISKSSLTSTHDIDVLFDETPEQKPKERLEHRFGEITIREGEKQHYMLTITAIKTENKVSIITDSNGHRWICSTEEDPHLYLRANDSVPIILEILYPRHDSFEQHGLLAKTSTLPFTLTLLP